MHELSLCQSILTIVQEKSFAKSFRRVNRIFIDLGEFAGVDKVAMLFCFNEAASGTLAEGAKLNFRDIPASALCCQCEKIFLLQARFEPCLHCGSHDIKLLSGEELIIQELEVM